MSCIDQCSPTLLIVFSTFKKSWAIHRAGCTDWFNNMIWVIFLSIFRVTIFVCNILIHPPSHALSLRSKVVRDLIFAANIILARVRGCHSYDIMMKGITFTVAFICYLCTVNGDNRTVVSCTVPCPNITVNSSQVRDVFVTSCFLNQVFVHGDASRVQVHALMDGALCGKWLYF